METKKTLLDAFPDQDEECTPTFVKHFRREEVMQLAATVATGPYFARRQLLDDFKAALLRTRLPAEMYDLIKRHNAVVSGSVAAQFLDGQLNDAWQGGFGPKDLDVYVSLGGAQALFEDARALPGVELCRSVVFRRHPPLGQPIDAENLEETAILYENPSIESLWKCCFRINREQLVFMDIVESAGSSPLLPITHFNLSHLKLAISAHGILEFHADWHERPTTVSFTSPREDHPASHEGERMKCFFQKYKDRGYTLKKSESAAPPGHICYVSTSCPLTLRSLNDDGVRYTPMTETAAYLGRRAGADVLNKYRILFRHGGRCRGSPGAFEKAMGLEDGDCAGEDAVMEQDTYTVTEVVDHSSS